MTLAVTTFFGTGGCWERDVDARTSFECGDHKEESDGVEGGPSPVSGDLLILLSWVRMRELVDDLKAENLDNGLVS